MVGVDNPEAIHVGRRVDVSVDRHAHHAVLLDHIRQIGQLVHGEDEVEQLGETLAVGGKYTSRHEGDAVTVLFHLVPFLDTGIHLVDAFLAHRACYHSQNVGFFLLVGLCITHALKHGTHSFRVATVHLTAQWQQKIFHFLKFGCKITKKYYSL